MGTVTDAAGARTGSRPVHFGEGFMDVATFDGSALGAGAVVEGPALIEEPFTVVVLAPGDVARLDPHGNYDIAIDQYKRPICPTVPRCLGRPPGRRRRCGQQGTFTLAAPPRSARSESCPWLKAMVDSGEIFHPLRWNPSDAFSLLQDVPKLESAGVVVRMPATWRANRPLRPQVTATVGGKAPSGLGKDALLDFHMEVTLDGEVLTGR